MINGKALLEAGYKSFKDTLQSQEGSYVQSWQKRIDDESGIRYFINISEWNHGRLIPNYPGKSPSFQSETQFTRGGHKEVVNISLHGEADRTIEDVEAFFDEMWTKMGFDHYERRSYSKTYCPDCTEAVKGPGNG